MTIGVLGSKDAVMFSPMKKTCLAWAALGALGMLATVESLWPADYPTYPSSGHYAPESGRFFFMVGKYTTQIFAPVKRLLPAYTIWMWWCSSSMPPFRRAKTMAAWLPLPSAS